MGVKILGPTKVVVLGKTVDASDSFSYKFRQPPSDRNKNAEGPAVATIKSEPGSLMGAAVYIRRDGTPLALSGVDKKTIERKIQWDYIRKGKKLTKSQALSLLNANSRGSKWV